MRSDSIDKKSAQEKSTPKICGIVRPIAAMGDYPAAHWQDVHDILAEAAVDAGYQARLVSESDAVGIILGNIVSNLYSDEIVICDVSGRNPNVMFELGMRVAFEKPTIIVTDDKTPFSFDVSPVKHIVYPATLRFSNIVKFKADIAAAIPATIAASKTEGYRGYLQQFGPIKVVELGTREFSVSDFASELEEIRRSLRAIENQNSYKNIGSATAMDKTLESRQITFNLGKVTQDQLDGIKASLKKISALEASIIHDDGGIGSLTTSLKPMNNFEAERVKLYIKSLIAAITGNSSNLTSVG